MFYIKKEVGNDIEVKIDLYDDEIFTQCPECGKEILVDTEMLIDVLSDGDFLGTSVYCEKCSEKRRTF